MTVVDQELLDLRRARARRDVAELDYRRALARAAEGHTQRELADLLGLSQPSVSSALRTAERVPMPAEGQRSASPYEVCQRYAAGELTRAEAIAELIEWDYVVADWRPAPGDDLSIVPPGTFLEVMDAAHARLIDYEMYAEVFDAVAES